MIETLFNKLLIIFISFTIIKALFVFIFNYILVRLRTKKPKPKNKKASNKIEPKLIVNKKSKVINKKPKFHKKYISIKDFISLGNIKICYYELFLIVILTTGIIGALIYRIVYLYNLSI